MPRKFSMDGCSKAKPATEMNIKMDSLDLAGSLYTSKRLRSAVAPIVICIYKYTNFAGDLLPDFRENNAALYQIQLEHDCRDSVVYQFKSKFEAFLRQQNEINPAIPKDCATLSVTAGVFATVTSGRPKSENAVPWRVVIVCACGVCVSSCPDLLHLLLHSLLRKVALYVVGCLDSVKNALLLLDGYFTQEARPVRGEPVLIEVHPHENVQLGSVTEDNLCG